MLKAMKYYISYSKHSYSVLYINGAYELNNDNIYY